MKKILSILTVLALAIAVRAQEITTRTNDFVTFDRIEASGDFEILYYVSDRYRVDWTHDTVLGSLVEVNVKDGTLYLSFNEKGMSSELKKTYKGRNARRPLLRATVYAPRLSGVTLTDNAVFNGTGETVETGTFRIDLSGKAQFKNVKLHAEKVSLQATRDARADLQATASQIDVTTDKSASVSLSQESDELTLSTAGASSVTVSGKTTDLVTSTQNSSKITLSGTVDSVRHDGKGSSEVDLLGAPMTAAEAVMSGPCKLYLSVSTLLKVDLKSGSAVYFTGDPRLDVVDIASSSLLHYDGKKKK